MYNLPLIETKLAPPVQKRVIRRERLLEQLAPARGVKLYLVSAEPGCGKTTLLASVALESRMPSVWYRLDPLDADPVLFLRYLIAGTRKALPGFGEESLDRLEQAGPGAYQQRGEIWRVFLAELSEWAREGLIYILDDFHFVDGHREIRGLVRNLVELMPDNVWLYVGTRDRVSLPLSRLRSRGQLVSLGREDLRFSPEEIREYLKGEGRRILPEEAAGLCRETDGWIAGVVLLGQDLYSKSEKAGKPLPGLLASNREIYNFLSREVFERLSPELQSLLESASLLENVVPAVVDQVLGTKDSAALLEEAEERRLFTFRAGDGQRSFSFNPLFRRFLAERLEARLGRQGIARLHLSWARALEADGDLVSALHHYLEGGEADAAVRLVEGLAEEYLGGGHADTLLRWLDRLNGLPEKPVGLDLVRARTLFELTRLEEAVEAGRRALAHARDSGDSGREFSAASCLGECLLALGRWEEGADLLKAALEMATTDRDRVAVLILLGCSYLARCQWDEASREYALALDLLGGSGGMEEARIRGFMGVLAWWRGDFRKAGRLMEMAVRNLRGADNRVMLVRAMNNLSFCLCGQAKYGAARRISREVLELCSRHYLASEEGSVLDNQGYIHASTGKMDAAVSSYLASLEIFGSAKSAGEQLFVLNHLAGCRRRRGDLAGALRDQQRAGRLAESVKMPYGMALSALNLGVILNELGRREEAEAQWARASQMIERMELGYLRFRLNFYRARNAFRSKQTEEALAGLEECLTSAKRYQYHNFLIQEGKMDLAFLVKGFEAGVERPYLSFLFERIGHSALQALPSLLEGPDYAQREAALRLLARLPAANISGTLKRYLRDGERETKRLARELLRDSPAAGSRRFDLLTAREMEIARLVTSGLSNREISERLYLSEATVKTHLNRVFHKLQVETRNQLAWELKEVLSEVKPSARAHP